MFGGETVFGAGQPCSSQYTVPVICYSCCHSGESGRDRQVRAPSTVSRRADKTSGQRIAVKSSKEEFVLQWDYCLLAQTKTEELAKLLRYSVLNIVKLIKGASL